MCLTYVEESLAISIPAVDIDFTVVLEHRNNVVDAPVSHQGEQDVRALLALFHFYIITLQ